MKARGRGATHKGLKREGNEDAYLVDNDNGLYVVCDGMGGHAAGEVASEKAVQVVSRIMGENRGVIQQAREGRVPVGQMESLAQSVLQTACREIYDLATSNPKLAGMGTTMTLLMHIQDRAIMAHVGDTRLYLLRGDEVHQLSTDHTMVNELIRNGTMGAEDAMNSPFAHVLARSIGTHPSVQVDTLNLELLSGDRFVLCTDGLHDHLTDPEMLYEQMGDEFDQMAQQLVQFANDSGGHDNATAVIVEVWDRERTSDQLSPRDTMVSNKMHALSANFLFEDLSLAQLSRVLDLCEIGQYDAGSVIFSEGTDCSCMYVVLDGEVAISRQGVTYGSLRTGQNVGETTLLTQRPARASLTALAPSSVLRIDGPSFRILIQRRPYLGIALLAQLGQRLGTIIDRSHDLMGAPPPETMQARGLDPADLF